MSFYMCRQGALSLALILLLVVICVDAAPMPAELLDGEQAQEQAQAQEHAQVQAQQQEPELTTIVTTLEKQLPQSQQQSQLLLASPQQPQHIDCQFAVDTTMDSLEQQQLQALQLQDNGCNVLQTTSTSTSSSSSNKPADADSKHKKSLNVLRHSMSGSSSQPLYELQLVVWPTDIEDDDGDVVPLAVATTPSTTTTTTTTTAKTTTAAPTKTTTPSVLPLYEDQLVVFPQMDFEEQNFDYFFDELEAAVAGTTTTTTIRPPRPSSTRPTIPRPTTATKPYESVVVLENYRVKHANGTEEHKLVLSNGLVNYMKLYLKRVGDKVINVQEGYNSLPVAGHKRTIQTLYYIADERGYNVYRMERDPQPSVLPIRASDKATKGPDSMPNI